MEFFLRYHLSETGIASEYTIEKANTLERYEPTGWAPVSEITNGTCA